MKKLSRDDEYIMKIFTKGSMPPAGYINWHTWARAQVLHGLKQTKCKHCGLYLFPQEQENHG